MFHHGPVIDNLKRLLMCSKRRNKSVIRIHGGNTSPNSLTFSTTTNCVDSSPDSLNCQPRLTTGEMKRRRSQHPLRVSNNFSESDVACIVSIKADDSDTVRTLCSITTEEDATCRDSEIPQNTTVRQANLNCHAEICSLETADHRAKVQEAQIHAVARTEDLVVTEYKTECQLSDERPKMIVNNALICCHRQLNSELCEVNCPQTGSPVVNQIESLQVSNNLAHLSQHQPSKCSATVHQDACQRSPLRVHVLSEESEPRTTCASITTSEPPSVEPLPFGCWPDGDAMGPDEAQVDGAADCKRPSGDAEAAKSRDTAGGDASVLIQCSENGRQSYENLHPVTSSVEETAPANKKLANDRFGSLSSELCVSLRRGLRGDDLIKRYLEKRDVSETVRARHRQRCGSINASMVDKILRKSSEATSCTTTAADAAATLRARLPKTSSTNATDVGNRAAAAVLSIAPSEREFRTAPVVSIVASVAAAANAMAAVTRANKNSASSSVAARAGRTRTPEGAGGGDMRRRKACLATGRQSAKILVPVVMNLRARRREQQAA